jgi:hypothetical protein
MKKILTISIVLLASVSCKKSNPQPTAQTQPSMGVVVCNCGEITNINQYVAEYFTYTVRNECTGNDTIVNNSTYYDYGLNMCFQQQW